MMLVEAIFAQAALLAGQLDDRQKQLLNLLCQTVPGCLEARLKDGLTAEDCGTAFITAASLYALAALQEAGQNSNIAEFRAGDLTVKRKDMDISSRCLQHQADQLIRPYCKDSFAFLGV